MLIDVDIKIEQYTKIISTFEGSNLSMKKHIKKKLLDEMELSSETIEILKTSNACIPVDHAHCLKKIPKDTTGYLFTELFTKNQIEQFIPFDEKLKKVLVDATGKSSERAHPLKYQHIVNLKAFRDMIVHTKEAESSPTYDYLYRKALTFKYTETLSAARDFCNFYLKENFVEECNCSNTW